MACYNLKPMKPLIERIHELNALLAPYAARHESRGRMREESPDDIRMPFQRDRARIIHSKAFRRLAGKTQVFVAGEGDHYRTRLTHTMEVAQITRDLARALGLNEDLAECIALAHDLGHAPFGHNGQDALDEWMRSKSAVGFEHNVQSHRIVTMLEIRGNGNGLNLTRDVVDGLFKHGGQNERGEPVDFCLEAQLANACDEIAYTAHDTDDGLDGGLFTYEELQTIPFAKHAADIACTRGTFIRSTLIDILARDLLEHAKHTGASGAPTIGISDALRSELRHLRTFLWERMYHHPAILQRMEHGKNVVRMLCETYVTHPPHAVIALEHRTSSSRVEAVKDYVSGMTDSTAMDAATIGT